MTLKQKRAFELQASPHLSAIEFRRREAEREAAIERHAAEQLRQAERLEIERQALDQRMRQWWHDISQLLQYSDNWVKSKYICLLGFFN